MITLHESQELFPGVGLRQQVIEANTELLQQGSTTGDVTELQGNEAEKKAAIDAVYPGLGQYYSDLEQPHDTTDKQQRPKPQYEQEALFVERGERIVPISEFVPRGRMYQVMRTVGRLKHPQPQLTPGYRPKVQRKARPQKPSKANQ